MDRQENYELVQKGFRVLVSSLSGYIGQEFSRIFGDSWWGEILDALWDQRDLPDNGGSYGDLVDSLDIANCIRVIDRKWGDVFKYLLPMNCRTWAKELMGVRNEVSHIGMQDYEQHKAERALDTMALLCKEVDPEGAEEIRALYKEVRSRAVSVEKEVAPIIVGVEQPKTDSRRGALKEGSLLQLVGIDDVQKTTLTRKVTYAGKTVIYPVYKVRLDRLYYNDQNDRIATWISRYEAENGVGSLSGLDAEAYNEVIEEFICDSNPEAIQRTQKNIELVGQREPGVALADGRIVDGNRRFTCLRRIQEKKTEPLYFETVIMDMDIREDRKQIKLLELSIQHGEEKKVDYDLIDYAVGTYRDVVTSGLLTVEEYAESANEAPAEVRKRIDIAAMINEFLDYICLPEQYHVARDYQVYSLFQEMMPLLRQLNDEDKTRLKHIVFNNAILKAQPDQRKFIRDIKILVKNDTYKEFFDGQKELDSKMEEKLTSSEIKSKFDIDKLAEENSSAAEEMLYAMERALQKSRAQVLKTKPAENVTKCIDLLLDVDTRLFDRLDVEEKEALSNKLDQLELVAKKYKELLSN